MQCIVRLSRYARILRAQEGVKRHVRGLKLNHAQTDKFEKLFPPREEFEARHIGPRVHDQKHMLKMLGFKVIGIF